MVTVEIPEPSGFKQCKIGCSEKVVAVDVTGTVLQ